MVTRPVPSSVVSLNTTQYVVAAETAGFVVQVKVCTPTVSIGCGSLSMPTRTPGLAPLLVSIRATALTGVVTVATWTEACGESPHTAHGHHKQTLRRAAR